MGLTCSPGAGLRWQEGRGLERGSGVRTREALGGLATPGVLLAGNLEGHAERGGRTH